MILESLDRDKKLQLVFLSLEGLSLSLGLRVLTFLMIYTTDTLKIKLPGPFRLDHWAIVFPSFQLFLLNAYMLLLQLLSRVSCVTLCDPME